MEGQPQLELEPHPMGDNAGIDMRLPMARQANKTLRLVKGRDTIIDLGDHGEVDADHVRFRDGLEPGQLVAYIRQEAADHKKVIVPVVVALGVVAAGIINLKYRKK